MKLTGRMHDAVLNSEVGKYIDRLIREEVYRSGPIPNVWHGNVIQALWVAFMSGCDVSEDEALPEGPTLFDLEKKADELDGLVSDMKGSLENYKRTFADIKKSIKNGYPSEAS